MTTTSIGSITPDREITLPPEIQATLQPGDEYLIWQTEDTILLKKVQRPTTIADIRAKVSALGVDPEAPSLEALSQIVREVRQG